MMQVIARDYEGLEGWGPWTKALKEPLIALSWPALLSQLLDVDPSFEEVYRCGKEEITSALATAEWVALRPALRLKLLVWLTDAVTICETVRMHLDRKACGLLQACSLPVACLFHVCPHASSMRVPRPSQVRMHLDKNADVSEEVRREMRTLQEEEEAQVALLAEATARAKSIQDKVAKQAALQAAQAERKKVGAKAAEASAAAAAAGQRGLEDEEARVATERATLESIRKKLRQKQVDRYAWPLRLAVTPEAGRPLRLAVTPGHHARSRSLSPTFAVAHSPLPSRGNSCRRRGSPRTPTRAVTCRSW